MLKRQIAYAQTGTYGRLQQRFSREISSVVEATSRMD